MYTEISSGAVVFHRDNPIQYLLLLSTYWGFPKGRVESGEDEHTAALREVREESGLDVTILDGFRHIDDYWYRRNGQRIHKQAIFFVAEAASVESKLSREHEDMIWLPYDDALARLKFAGLKELLTKAHEFVTSDGAGS